MIGGFGDVMAGAVPFATRGAARNGDGLGKQSPGLRQSCDLFRPDQFVVDLDAEPRRHRRSRKALPIDPDILDESVLMGSRWQEHLEELAVPNPHDHVQISDIVDRVSAVMNLQVHTEALGQVGCLDERRDAALHRDVAAQVIGGLQENPLGVGAEAPGVHSVATRGMSILARRRAQP